MKIPAKGELHGRSIKEWIGKTPDTPAPPRVQLRILLRQERKCALTGIKIDGIKIRAQCDHKIRLEAGGENRESNLQMIAIQPHKEKTAAEEKIETKVSSLQKKALGIVRSKQTIQQRLKLKAIVEKGSSHSAYLARMGAKGKPVPQRRFT